MVNSTCLFTFYVKWVYKLSKRTTLHILMKSIFSCHLPNFPANYQIFRYRLFFLLHVVKSLSIYRWNLSFLATCHIFLPIPKFFCTLCFSSPILSWHDPHFDETLLFLPLTILSCQSPNFTIPFVFPAPYCQGTFHISMKPYFFCRLPYFPANVQI